MLAELLARYGYLMVVGGIIVEGDATLVTASFLAHRGYLVLWIVMAIAAVTSTTMNQIYFRIGRKHGVERVAKAEGRPLFARIMKHMRTHAIWLVLVSRFIFGFRMAIPATVGALGMGAVRFFIADACGAIIWAVTLGSTGYAIGQVGRMLVGDLERHDYLVALALCVLTIAWTVYRHRRATAPSP